MRTSGRSPFISHWRSGAPDLDRSAASRPPRPSGSKPDPSVRSDGYLRRRACRSRQKAAPSGEESGSAALSGPVRRSNGARRGRADDGVEEEFADLDRGSEPGFDFDQSERAAESGGRRPACLPHATDRFGSRGGDGHARRGVAAPAGEDQVLASRARRKLKIAPGKR